MKPTCYFQKAKKAAKKLIADPSAAHGAAMEVLRKELPNKTDQLYCEMGWSAVLAARN